MRWRTAPVPLALALAALAATGEEPVGAAPRGGQMVAVSGGRFKAGERIGVLQDTVAYYGVHSFLLDATEVTVSQYAACARAGACPPAHATVRWSDIPAAERASWSSFCNGDRPDRAEHPANCVDWFQARAFCAWAGKRLPTEEEWEWAARNGSAGTPYPWGAAPPGDRACWSGDRPGAGGTGTCPVASHPGGDARSGLKDLAGGVWEWTATEVMIFTDSRGRGGTPARIARGGGWADADPGRLTAAVRAKDVPGERAADLGFRCAHDR